MVAAGGEKVLEHPCQDLGLGRALKISMGGWMEATGGFDGWLRAGHPS